MTIFKVTLNCGTQTDATHMTPEVKTDRQAAIEIGISTQKFNKVIHRRGINPLIIAGSEKNKVPTYVYTAEQIDMVRSIIADQP